MSLTIQPDESGDVVVLRRDPSEWTGSLPPGPAISLDATRRDTIYD